MEVLERLYHLAEGTIGKISFKMSLINVAAKCGLDSAGTGYEPVV
jgi:hypothetical protein